MKMFNKLMLSVALGSAAAGAAAAQTEVVIWVGGEPGETTIYETLADELSAANPDVVYTVVTNTSDVFNPALVPALSAGEGPDLFTFGTGPGQPAALIDGGLVADLTPYYYEHGWDEVIPEGVLMQTSKDGKLWALGNEVESTGIFYNKAIFEEVGIAVPRTWAEMQAAVAALKEAGYDTPIGLGAADKWSISHWQSMMFGRYAGPEGIENVLFADGKWTDAPFVAASDRLQQMGSDGWFGPNPVAINYAEMMDSFWAGDLPMTFTGPWVINGGIDAAGDRAGQYGVFQAPPFEEGQEIVPTESIGNGWYIRSNSEHKDEAVAYLNALFMTTEGRTKLLTGGMVPVGPLGEASQNAQIPEMRAELNASVDRYRDNGTVPAFLDTITPGRLTNVAYDGLQALLLDAMSPEEFTQELQSAWEKAKEDGEAMEQGGVAPR
ncbi:extracellular solute-binding protein [Limimaricola pyoseonensis]|uniref:Raffinose/stachyose/melibiose transport system substrate-binding protein n=1 Tax=Limimaricola pyoseonensis TaxID=521013 RepID=A0A1G7CCI4_9RHOB|nr:extracellular solute-binding protein [Limimaricola pyoseonensis]SDE36943.1 raffinose/stachyose/melibiose transport system substrate-binding protein [Limimaricola pyoseonensis]